MKFKRFSLLFTLVVILSMMLAFGASAQSEVEEGQTSPIEAPVFASALLDYKVLGVGGDLLGEVDGFVFDANTNQLYYLIVEPNDVFPSKRLIPWSVVQLMLLEPETVDPTPDAEASLEPTQTATLEPTADLTPTVTETPAGYEPETLILYLDIDELTFDDMAPAIEASVLEDFETAPAGWDVDASIFWSAYSEAVSPDGLGETVDPADLVYVSTGFFGGIDYEVYDMNSNLVGEVEDYLINPDGAIPFALVETSAFLSQRNVLVVVGIDALIWDPLNLAYFMDVNASFLNSAPRIDPQDLPDLTAPGWDEDWLQFWLSPFTDQNTPQPGATFSPTLALTAAPTLAPTLGVTEAPTQEPTVSVTLAPTVDVEPSTTVEPSPEITLEPTADTGPEPTPLATESP